MEIDDTEADVSAVVMGLRPPENILSDVQLCLKRASGWFPDSPRFQDSLATAQRRLNEATILTLR
jgi:hypothetical protein